MPRSALGLRVLSAEEADDDGPKTEDAETTPQLRLLAAA
jgi:hypothetical protein